MADDTYQTAPNFVNPQYATPEQLKSLREYSDQLMTGKGQMPVHRWTQGVSNIVNALVGGALSNQANRVQSGAAQQNASDQAAIISQLQNGQLPDPATQGRLAANPMASPEQRALISHLVSPQAVTSPYGQPGYISPNQNMRPMGAPGYDTGAPFSQSTPDASQSGMGPAPSRAPPPTPTQAQVDGAVASRRNFNGSPRVFSATGNVPSAGGPAPGAVLPTAPAPVTGNAAGGYSGPMTLDQLAAKGRQFAAQRGVNESQTALAKQDLEAAQTAPSIKRIAGIMLDDIHAHGDQMTFGPSAESSNNIKKFVANYAPGLMGDKAIQGLAAADSFEKMSAQLTSMLAKGGGTDAQLFNNMKSVPGAHNSKEGAEALLKMVTQVADQQQALRQTTMGMTGDAYEKARNDFYAKNQILNPLTGHPIKLDLEAQKAQPQYEKTAINKQTGERLGLVDGKWEAIK